MAQADFREIGKGTAQFLYDPAQRNWVACCEGARLSEGLAPYQFSNLVRPLLKAAGRDQLGHVIPRQPPKYFMHGRIRLGSLAIQGEKRFVLCLRISDNEAIPRPAFG
jgi:hypothetical protein